MTLNKILILTSEFPPQPGGIGNHAYNLAKELHQNGFKVTVLCDTRSLNKVPEKKFDKVLPFKVVRIVRKKIILTTYISRIVTALSLTPKNDIIICSGKFPLWLGSFLTFFYNKKFIAIIHGREILLPNKLLRKFTDFSLTRFNKVIAVSNYTKSLLSHLALKNIHVIHNGFAVNKLEGRKESRPVPILITVGKITQRKGQHNVINAMPVLLQNFPDLQYHIVGIPTQKEKVQQLVLNLGVEKAVFFHGAVTDAEKNKLLSSADVFIMLSEATKKGDVEGFGIAILEANAHGLPAIGAMNSGIEEAIEDGVSGRLINSRDSKALNKALEEIINNYQNYSKDAKNWSQNFTWNKVIKSYIEIIKE